MKITSLLVSFGVALSICTSAGAATIDIDSRIGLGLTPDNQGFPAFFANGFVQGATSHTNTIAFDDGVVEVEFTLTVEAFAAGGAPAGLFVNNQASGIDGGANNTEIDAGEQLKVTYDNIAFSVIGAPPSGLVVDLSSFQALIGSARLAAFTPGTDTFTYAGVGAGSVTGDDTQTIEFVPNASIGVGDMSTITGDGGSFRALYVSLHGSYETVIPEPATLGLLVISIVGIAASRRMR